MKDSSQKKPPQPASRSIAERVSLYLSVFLLALVVSLILYSWGTQERKPPILTVEVEAIVREVDGQYYVPFSATNQGGTTAESVEVVAQLSGCDRLEESGSQQIGFLSGGETRSGAFIFSCNPQQGQLKVRVASYKLP